jgi:hypothetical protein
MQNSYCVCCEGIEGASGTETPKPNFGYGLKYVVKFTALSL